MSFAQGALSVIAVYTVYKIWELFQYPSIDSMEKRCSKPIPLIGDHAKVTVWGLDQSGRHFAWTAGVSDSSPYVSRVEAFLRLIKQPYIKEESKGMTENPRGKVPFANIQGQMVDDSSAIIDTLKNIFDVKIDDHLSEEDRAKGHLIRQMLFGSLYWVGIHFAFETNAGRKRFLCKVDEKLPPVIRGLVSALIIRTMHDQLFGCGIGRMPHSVIIKKGQDDVRCLSAMLGSNEFFFGEKSFSPGFGLKRKMKTHPIQATE